MGKVTEDINRKFNIKRLLIIVIIILVLVIGAILTTNFLGRAYDKTKNTYTEITIKENDSLVDIASNLKKHGIINDESRFVGLSKFLFKEGKYQPGKYLLSPCMNFNSLASTMINGITSNLGITIPAGYSMDQTFSALEQADVVSKKDLYNVVDSVDFSGFEFIDSKVDKKKQLEGFLLPDRYDFDTSADAMMVITTMLDNFDNAYTDEFRARTEELGLSIRDVIIIASMIETTSTVNKEKAKISSVIHNRINLGIPFKNGFPKHPLCSPGIASIEAALYPEETDYIYYISSYKLNGSHEFAKNSSEYLDLLSKYKSAKKSASEESEQ